MSESSEADDYGDDYEDDYSVESIQQKPVSSEEIENGTDANNHLYGTQLPSSQENNDSSEQIQSSQENNDSSEQISEENPFHGSNRYQTYGVSSANDDASEDALRKQTWESSNLLVAEGEKNIALALDLVKVRDVLTTVQEENKQLRSALLDGINGNMDYEVQDFMNISILELLRIRMQACTENKTGLPITFSTRRAESFLPTSKACRVDVNTPEEIKESNDTFKKEDTARWKEKMSKMMDTTRRERELKSKLERDVFSANQRVEALSDHIEKLMIHLKHEATSKAKSLNECTRCRKEIELLKKRNETMEKRNNRKNRAIDDLKDGAKILEDQLTLMDEKYMDLRMKLDWTRTQTERVMHKKDEEIKDLRAKLLILKQDLIAYRGKKKKKSKEDNSEGKAVQHNSSPIKKKNVNLQKLPSTSDGVT